MENEPVYSEDNYCHVVNGLVYITTSCQGPGINLNLYNSLPRGCECISACKINDCPCFLGGVKKDLLLLKSPQKELTTFQDYIADINFPLGPITECNNECKCDAGCFNRLVQNGPRLGLEIVSLGAKGFGVITSRTIPNGAFVSEYAGEIIGIEEAQNRFILSKASDSNYVLILREHCGAKEINITIIDPTVIGNIGRYINHSCQPNLRVIPVRINSMIPVAAMFAVKTIQAGEEICYDYDSLSNYVTGKTPDSLASDILNSSIDPTKVTFDSDVPHSSGTNLQLDDKDPVSVNISKVCTKIFSNKRCLCLSDKCQKFLPSNPNLFM